MSCPEDSQLQDYVDAMLPPARRRSVERHLGGCAACRDEVERLRRLVAMAGALRRDERPERDLWPGIEARIGRGGAADHGRFAARRGWAVSWIGLAAAAVLVVALTWVAVRWDEHAAPRGEGSPAVASVEGPEQIHRSADRARVEGGVMHLRVDLLRSIGEREDTLDPATRELVDHNLEIIDRAVAEISAAQRQDPDNPALGSLLATTYQREAALLKQISRL